MSIESLTSLLNQANLKIDALNLRVEKLEIQDVTKTHRSKKLEKMQNDLENLKEQILQSHGCETIEEWWKLKHYDGYNEHYPNFQQHFKEMDKRKLVFEKTQKSYETEFGLSASDVCDLFQYNFDMDSYDDVKRIYSKMK